MWKLFKFVKPEPRPRVGVDDAVIVRAFKYPRQCYYPTGHSKSVPNIPWSRTRLPSEYRYLASSTLNIDLDRAYYMLKNFHRTMTLMLDPVPVFRSFQVIPTVGITETVYGYEGPVMGPRCRAIIYHAGRHRYLLYA